METFLRPAEIAEKIGTSKNFVRNMIGKSKCREIREEGKKTLFCVEDIIKFIQLVGK